MARDNSRDWGYKFAMARTVRKHVVVQPGGVVEIQSPDLPAGAEADVTVRIQVDRPTNGQRLTALIGRGTGLYKSADEVDSQIRELRQEWQR